jgi:hypothetical protein
MLQATLRFSYFGFSGNSYRPETAQAGLQETGIPGLLQQLALRLGIVPPAGDLLERNIRWLHALRSLPAGNPFADMLEKDPIAMAARLLALRDRLWLHLPNPEQLADAPPRLSALYQAGNLAGNKAMRGMPDLVREIRKALQQTDFLALNIECCEPEEFLPHWLKELLSALKGKGCRIQFPDNLVARGKTGSNLQRLQHALIVWAETGSPCKLQLDPQDPSLRIHQKQKDSTAALELALMLRTDPDKALLYRADNGFLANAVRRCCAYEIYSENPGDSMSITQVLRSFLQLLWEPVQVGAVYEFLNLPVKPFPGKLARALSDCIEQKPGLGSPLWEKTVADYFAAMEQDEADAQRTASEKARYAFWFESRRYQAETGILHTELCARIQFLHDWAAGYARLSEDQLVQEQLDYFAGLCRELHAAVVVLSENQEYIREKELIGVFDNLLDSYPVTGSVYSSGAGVCFTSLQPLPPLRKLIWSDFSALWSSGTADRPWWLEEKQWLQSAGYTEPGAGDINRLERYATARTMAAVQDELILSYAAYRALEPVSPHLVWLLLQEEDGKNLELLAAQPPSGIAYTTTERIFRPELPLELELDGLDDLLPRDQESYSSLRNMIYAPHRYILESILRLRSRIRYRPDFDITMRGSIIHALVERLFLDPELDKLIAGNWEAQIRQRFQSLLEEEAGMLLLPRYSSVRNHLESEFVNHVQKVFRPLQAGWQVVSVEEAFKRPARPGHLNFDIGGKADLILKRNDQYLVVDVKSGSPKFLREQIKKGKDWQLMLYALYAVDSDQVETAYFSTRKGIFIGQEEPNIVGIFRRERSPHGGYAEMHTRFFAGVDERLAELRSGRVHLRITEDNCKALNELYGEDLAGISLGDKPEPFENFQFLFA